VVKFGIGHVTVDDLFGDFSGVFFGVGVVVEFHFEFVFDGFFVGFDVGLGTVREKNRSVIAGAFDGKCGKVI
jgi:hypothetical protein